jgi:hypothetical protein
MRISLITLYIFNLIVGTFVLFATEGRKGALSGALILHICFSIACVILLAFLIRQFKIRANYFVLLILSLFVAFMIPVIRSFIFGTVLSIIDGNFSLNVGVVFFSVGVGIVSVFFWPIMGIINFSILSWYKRQLSLNTSR